MRDKQSQRPESRRDLSISECMLYDGVVVIRPDMKVDGDEFFNMLIKFHAIQTSSDEHAILAILFKLAGYEDNQMFKDARKAAFGPVFSNLSA